MIVDKGHPIVPKRSNCKIVAIVCSALQLSMCGFAVFEAVLAAITGVIGVYTNAEIVSALVITVLASLLMAAQSAYAFYGMLVSHKTLKHIGLAWVAYPIVAVLTRLSISYLDHARSLFLSDDVQSEVNFFGVMGNSIVLLICFAIGIVLMLYAKGELSDKRIVMCLSGAAYVISVALSAFQYISFYTQIGNFKMLMTIAAVTSITITLSSNFITYGAPFFLALSMKNTSERNIGEDHALS